MLDFLGIGAQKAGTTWLYELLRRHPGIAFPGGKEVHFWNRPVPDLRWYRSLLGDSDNSDGVMPDVTRRRAAPARHTACNEAPRFRRGEITPAYAILPVDRLHEIRDFAPDVRLIYMIRNPIDRAWSAALMAVQRAEMMPSEASDQWFIDHFRSAGSLARGDYERCLRNWRSVFPESQMLVLRFEMLRRDPRGLLERVAQHLDIDPKPFGDLPEEKLRRRIFAGASEPLRPTLYPVLREMYAEKIVSLARYLGEDLSEWLR